MSIPRLFELTGKEDIEQAMAFSKARKRTLALEAIELPPCAEIPKGFCLRRRGKKPCGIVPNVATKIGCQEADTWQRLQRDKQDDAHLKLLGVPPLQMSGVNLCYSPRVYAFPRLNRAILVSLCPPEPGHEFFETNVGEFNEAVRRENPIGEKTGL